MSCEVALSYLEVYNETIRDLLEPSDAMLAIREDATKGTPHTTEAIGYVSALETLVLARVQHVMVMERPGICSQASYVTYVVN